MLTAPPARAAGTAAQAPLAGTQGRSQGRSPGRRSPSSSRPAATIALAALTVASAAGLFRVFSGHRWIGPVLGTVAIVHLVCWLLRRRGVGSLLAVPIVVATVVLMAAWTVLGRYTTYGVPTATTWDHALSALRDLSNEIASMTPPVQPTTAFLLVAVAGAAAAAAVGDWAAFRWRAPLLALAPGLGAFIFCCTSGGGRGRAAVVGLEVAAACLFLMVERASGGDGLVWFAGVRAGVGPWVAAAGGIITAASVVAAVSLSPALARRDGTGVMGWRSGLGGQGGERIVPNPLVDLRTRLTELAHQPVFLVDSTVPSYWRLTSLDTFDGVTWTSTGSYGTFGSKLPGTPPAGASVRTARATFQIQQLNSVWLPAQFDPITVEGAKHVTYDPRSNSLLTAKSTADGLQYSVTSYQYLNTLSTASLEAAPPLTRSSTVDQNLQLPSLSAQVTALAHAIIAGRSTEYDRAIAIQSFLRGPDFSYSLDPPKDGTGTEALYTFLFTTRTGYCQQFAGAYAVLARAVGLPTRLAVGFAQGDPSGAGFQVHDSDYHTWPEVYFGPTFGWVPFEPTPGFAVPGSNGYSDTHGSSTGPATTPTTTAPTTVPGSNSGSAQPIQKPHSTASSTTIPAGASPHHATGTSLWWLAIPAVALVWIGLTAGIPRFVRRARRRRASRSGTEAVVLDAWGQLEADLQWHGIERSPHETDDEFARRASVALRRLGIDGRWTYGGLEALAALARRAKFAPSVPEGTAEQAEVTAREVHDRLAAVTTRRQRLARLWMPPPGTRRRLTRYLRSGGRTAARAPGTGAGSPAV